MYLTRSLKFSRDTISNLIFLIFFYCIWQIKIFAVYEYNLLSSIEVIVFLWTGYPTLCLHFEQHLRATINVCTLIAYSRATRAFLGLNIFLKITGNVKDP